MIEYQLANSDEELQEILNLQEQNLQKNLNDEEKNTQGFVTVQHRFEELKKMKETHRHTIAKFENKVVGYALSMDVSCKNDIEILVPMFNKIDAVYKESYIAMGQICIDKNHRGKGVFKGLYDFMKAHFSDTFSAIITEIDAQNTRSIRAHQKVGFTELSRYFLHDQEWVIVTLKCE